VHPENVFFLESMLLCMGTLQLLWQLTSESQSKFNLRQLVFGYSMVEH
jgi:hypothetical protein